MSDECGVKSVASRGVYPRAFLLWGWESRRLAGASHATNEADVPFTNPLRQQAVARPRLS